MQRDRCQDVRALRLPAWRMLAVMHRAHLQTSSGCASGAGWPRRAPGGRRPARARCGRAARPHRTAPPPADCWPTCRAETAGIHHSANPALVGCDAQLHDHFLEGDCPRTTLLLTEPVTSPYTVSASTGWQQDTRCWLAGSFCIVLSSDPAWVADAHLCRYSTAYVAAGSPRRLYERLRPSVSVTKGAVCTMATGSTGNFRSAATPTATTAICRANNPLDVLQCHGIYCVQLSSSQQEGSMAGGSFWWVRLPGLQ
jgi:hypothetical protein